MNNKDCNPPKYYMTWTERYKLEDKTQLVKPKDWNINSAFRKRYCPIRTVLIWLYGFIVGYLIGLLSLV